MLSPVDPMVRPPMILGCLELRLDMRFDHSWGRKVHLLDIHCSMLAVFVLSLNKSAWRRLDYKRLENLCHCWQLHLLVPRSLFCETIGPRPHLRSYLKCSFWIGIHILASGRGFWTWLLDFLPTSSVGHRRWRWWNRDVRAALIVKLVLYLIQLLIQFLRFLFSIFILPLNVFNYRILPFMLLIYKVHFRWLVFIFNF